MGSCVGSVVCEQALVHIKPVVGWRVALRPLREVV
jgi:hypothetical protein